MVTLNTREGGRRMIESSVELPPGVKASLGMTLTGAFNTPLTDSGSVAVSWEFVEHPLRAMPPRAQEALPGIGRRDASKVTKEMAAPDHASETMKGAFRLDLGSGKTAAEPVETVQALLQAVRANRGPDARLAHVPEPQFLAIYDLNTRERVEQFRTNVSFAPFFVSDGKVIYESGSYSTRIPTGIMQEPRQIRAVDLRTGERAWSEPIRDINRRADPPP